MAAIATPDVLEHTPLIDWRVYGTQNYAIGKVQERIVQDILRANGIDLTLGQIAMFGDSLPLQFRSIPTAINNHYKGSETSDKPKP